MSLYDIENQTDLEYYLSGNTGNDLGANITSSISLLPGVILTSNIRANLTSSSNTYSMYISSSSARRIILDAQSQAAINRFIYSNGYTTNPNDFTIGDIVIKDMTVSNFDYEMTFNSNDPYFPGMSYPTNINIVQGDKLLDDRLRASAWRDLGSDIFDDWGYFFIYNPPTQEYYFPILDPMNQANGVMITQTFTAFGRTFTITHGYPVQGIFKFDISVADGNVFRFGGYGNMGSDNDEIITFLQHKYTILSNVELSLYYSKQEEMEDDNEILFTYVIPKQATDNCSRTYAINHPLDDDENTLITREITNGVLVYFSKTNDVKNWIIDDITPTFSLLFSGGNVAMSSTSDFSLTTLTLECWIKSTDTSGAYQSIITKPNAYGLFQKDGKLTVYDWPNAVTTQTSVSINDGNWHHVCFVIQDGVTDGSSIYVDGERDGSLFTYTCGDGSGMPLRFGDSGSTQPFIGNIGEVRIWSMALSEGEIESNYNKRVSITTEGLAGYFKMNEGYGTTLNNCIPETNPMTISANVEWDGTNRVPIM